MTNVAFGFLPLIKSGHMFFIASLAMRCPDFNIKFSRNSNMWQGSDCCGRGGHELCSSPSCQKERGSWQVFEPWNFLKLKLCFFQGMLYPLMDGDHEWCWNYIWTFHR